MQIGMALSGGGIRATVFHLGVLARFAVDNRLEEVSFLSTISGGSLCIGLVFAGNNGLWPSSGQYCGQVIPRLHQLLTRFDLERRLWFKTLLTPKYLLHRRAKCLSSLLEEMWGIQGDLCDLPEYPRWVINASCHETGKRWRFEKKRMGDFVFGESPFPKFPVSDAIAASAAVPFAIGSLVLDTTKFQWEGYFGNDKRPITPEFNKVHLWDGAVYDNLGTEAFAKRKDGYDFLVVSDASSTLETTKWIGWKRYARIYDIASSQSQNVRSRFLMDKFINHELPGCYLNIGNSMEYILRKANRHTEIDGLRSKCLSQEEATKAKYFERTLRRLTESEFESLFRHGFEVADCTLYAYCEEQFRHLTFSAWSGWE